MKSFWVFLSLCVMGTSSVWASPSMEVDANLIKLLSDNTYVHCNCEVIEWDGGQAMWSNQVVGSTEEKIKNRCALDADQATVKITNCSAL